MITAVNICAVLLVVFTGRDTQVVEALKSTLKCGSSEDTACTYQHELVCLQPLTVSVQGGSQRFDFGFLHCARQFFTCTNDCCRGCTIHMTSEETSSLSQSCEGKQSCRIGVTRTFIKCGFVNVHSFYSHESTVEYRCVHAPSLPSTTETTLAVSRLPESSESTTESQTPPSDVSEETVTSSIDVSGEMMTSSRDNTTTPKDDVWTSDAWSVSTDTTEQSQAAVTDEGGRGGSHFSATSGSPDIPTIGGAVAGAIILLAVCIALLLCWRRGRFRSHRKEPSARAVANAAYELSMEPLEDPLQPRVPETDVTPAETSARNAAPDTDYDHLGAKKTNDVRPPDGTYGHLSDGDDAAPYDHTGGNGKRDVIGNVYDSTSPAEALEEDTYHHTSRTNRGPDVIAGLYDVARAPDETGSDENEALDKTENAAGTLEASEDKGSVELEQTPDPTYANS